MATYLTGQPLFLPSVQPYQPNFQLYAGALQMKQTQYDANRKQISNLYGSLLNSPLTRDSNVQARDEFFKTIDYEIQKLAGVDLSLQENVDTAARLFTSLYDNKNIVKDMIWTKNFQSEMDVAEGFRNCVDPEKCGGQYWDGGVQALEYKRQEFRNASDEQAMGFDDARYSPFVNVQERAAKIFKEMGWNYKPMPTMDGAWIIQTKNGEPIVGPLYAHLSAVLGEDPKIRDYYRTKSYLDRKNFASSNAQQYGSVDAAEAAYISEAQRSINDTFRQMNQEAKQESANARGKAEDIRRGQQEGFIDKSAEIQSQMDNLFGTADKFDRFDEETSTILTSTAGTAKADLRASGDIIDQNMAALMLSQDLNNAARILAYTDYEVDIKVNEVWKMERQHQLDKNLASYKAQLEAEAAEKEAMGPPELNKLYSALTNIDVEGDPQAAYNQMMQFAGETSQQAKSTNYEVLNQVFKQAQGSANAKGGLNQTQAAEDAMLIVERVLKQYKGNAEYNGSAADRKRASELWEDWNGKSKAEKIGWSKTFNIDSIVSKMPYMSVHNIIETSLGTKGANFFEENGYNKSNRAYLKNTKSALGDLMLEAENQYLEAQAWNDVKKNAHNTVVNKLKVDNPDIDPELWNTILNPNNGAWRSKNSFAFKFAQEKSFSKDMDPAEKVKKFYESLPPSQQSVMSTWRTQAAGRWEKMTDEQKGKYKNKESYIVNFQADHIPDNFDENKVKVPIGDGKFRYISAKEFFTESGEVKSKYSWAEKKWMPGNSSAFWTSYRDGLLRYSNMTLDDLSNKGSIGSRALGYVVDAVRDPGLFVAQAVYGGVSLPGSEQEVYNNNLSRLIHSDSKTALDESDLVKIYKEAYNTARIFKGGQTYAGLKGGGSTVAQGVSMFVDYNYHNAQSTLLERNFLQNAMTSTLGSEVRLQFGKGKLPENTSPEALQFFQTLMSQAIKGKKESRPTWMGEYNPIGGGNEKWQQYTMTLTDPAMLKQLSQKFSTADDDSAALFKQLMNNNGQISIYLKDNAANNDLHNMTKKSAFERRLDYEGTAPIAYGKYDNDLHNLKLSVLPNGYNVSGNVAVGYDENNNLMYDFLNQDYYGNSYNPLSIQNLFDNNILSPISNQLGRKSNSAFPNYVR
jgi:hypothetical protein